MQETPGPSRGESAFCSWSGGKDSCLALHRARQAGANVTHLVNMLVEDGTRSRSHGLRPAILEAQASALGMRLVAAATSWQEYEQTFIAQLQALAGQGVSAGVFGDIDTPAHREWEEKVCRAAGMRAALPLWQEPRRALLDEFLGLGFRALIVVAREGLVPAEFLGRELDRHAIDDLEALGVDACGENGEFHTVVFDGPLFARPLRLRQGQRVCYEGCWAVDLELEA